MVIGGSGLLGGHLAIQAKNRYNVVATFNSHPLEIQGCKCIELDITRAEKTESIIKKEQPDFIILSSALRNVDFCENNKEKTSSVNVVGARNVAVASNSVHAKLIYLSTDMVFDGKKGYYKEEDSPNPKNHYGQTKLEGEREVEGALEDYVIARVSVLYHWNMFTHTTNFVEWIYRNLKAGKPLSLFSDQFRCVTFIENANDALLGIWEKDERGIFHVVGKDCISRDAVGLELAEVFGFDCDLISKTSWEEGEWQAHRPKRLCLDASKMESRLGIRPMSLREGLLKMKDEHAFLG
jgi:dTDP-4-dehydrorhamnose reductase